jgi:hypothetical protein
MEMNPMSESRADRSGRLRTVRILAVAMAASGIGFGLFTAVLGIVSPAQEPHAFHNTIVAALLIVISAPPAVVVARSPERAIRPLVILAVVAVAALATMAAALTPDPFTLPFVVLVGVLWVLVPTRADGWPAGRPNFVLVGLSVIVGVALAPYVIEQAGLQRADHASEHAAFFHWVEMAFYATAIPLLGLLAGLRPRAYRPAAWAAAAALAVMGVSSIVFAEYASALPGPWGWAAAAGGAAIVAVAEFGARRTTSASGGEK